MSRAQGPVARLYGEGGGVVTSCSDVEEARRLLLAELEAESPWLWEELCEEERAAALPPHRARITRGRIVHALPGTDAEAEGWSWQFVPGSGRGSTPAVEWSDL